MWSVVIFVSVYVCLPPCRVHIFVGKIEGHAPVDRRRWMVPAEDNDSGMRISTPFFSTTKHSLVGDKHIHQLRTNVVIIRV